MVFTKASMLSSVTGSASTCAHMNSTAADAATGARIKRRCDCDKATYRKLLKVGFF